MQLLYLQFATMEGTMFMRRPEFGYAFSNAGKPHSLGLKSIKELKT